MSEELNFDLWGQEYRITCKRMKLGQTTILSDKQESTSWFPVYEGYNGRKSEKIGHHHFILDEMKSALLSLKNKQAPGPNCITQKIMKVILEKDGKYFFDTLLKGISVAV